MHYFADVQEMVTIFLGVRRLLASHTGENISFWLLDICQEWDIESSKVVSVTVDLGANIGLGVKLAFGEEKLIYCFAHTLNLVAQKSIGLYSKTYSAEDDPVEEEEEMLLLDREERGEVQPDPGCEDAQPLVDLLKRMKRTIRFMKKSEVGTRRLTQLQMDEGEKESQCHSLMLDVRTRWNSIFLMVERYVELSPFVARALLEMPTAPPMLGGEDIQVLREVMRVLKPLFTATTNMSGQKYVTASMSIPIVRLLNLVCVIRPMFLPFHFSQFDLKFITDSFSSRHTPTWRLKHQLLKIYYVECRPKLGRDSRTLRCVHSLPLQLSWILDIRRCISRQLTVPTPSTLLVSTRMMYLMG